jgi:hypothetical protein
VSEIDVMSINIGGIKSKLQKDYYRAFAKMQKDPACIAEYTEMEDRMISETTDLSEMQIDELFIEEKGKLLSRILDKLTKAYDFQKTSMTQPDSSRTDIPKS